MIFGLLLQTFAATMIQAAAVIPVIINTDIRYQVIDGFGASDCWSFQKLGDWPLEQKSRIADLLFSVEHGIGLSQWRFNLGGGINTSSIDHPWRTVATFETGPGEYDWSQQSAERWFLQAAQERGVEQFTAFVNSPPGRMTRNGLTNCNNGMGSTNLKAGWEGQFARYLTDILVHFRDQWNLEFDYISPVNEPQWEWNDDSNQEGNRAANSDFRNIIVALYDSLTAAAVSTKISVAESGDLPSWYQYRNDIGSEYGTAYGNYLGELIADPSTSDKIAKHLGGHSYWSDNLESELVQDRQALAVRLNNYQDAGWKYWVTEYSILEGPYNEGGRGRDLTMETALNVARVIHFDLTLLKASSWQWWTALSPEDYKDGLLYTNSLTNPADLSIIESKLFWSLGNFSRFIRPGYQRIELTGASNKYGLMGSAYLSPNLRQAVIVLVNVAAQAVEVEFSFAGLLAKGICDDYQIYITSDQAGDDLRSAGGGSLGSLVTIPGRSVVTLISRSTDDLPIFEGYNPDRYQLYQNYPNPFNEETSLAFNMVNEGSAKLSIYSILGERIHSVEWDQIPSGIQSYRWDGRLEDNRPLASGTYLYLLKAGGDILTRSMVYVK